MLSYAPKSAIAYGSGGGRVYEVYSDLCLDVKLLT